MVTDMVCTRNTLAGLLFLISFINFLGLGVNSPYSYDKSPTMDISPPHSYSPLPQSIYSQNGLPSPQKSMSPGYESPYNSHIGGGATTIRQNGTSGGLTQASTASPASPPHSYSPLPHVYGGQNGQNRQNGNNLANQNITITTSAPSPTLSAQSGSLNSPSEHQQMNKLWNGKMLDSVSCQQSNQSHLQNGSQNNNFVQHHPQQQHHQPHHHQNNREMMGSVSPPSAGMMQRVGTCLSNF